MEKMVGRVIGMNRSWISTHICPSRFEINISAERWEPRDEGERNVKRETHYKVEVSAEEEEEEIQMLQNHQKCSGHSNRILNPNRVICTLSCENT